MVFFYEKNYRISILVVTSRVYNVPLAGEEQDTKICNKPYFSGNKFQTIGYLPLLPIKLKACKPVTKEISWDESNELVERMRKVRIEKKLTFAELGRLLGVTSSTVWNWENGRSKLKKKYIECIRGFIL